MSGFPFGEGTGGIGASEKCPSPSREVEHTTGICFCNEHSTATHYVLFVPLSVYQKNSYSLGQEEADRPKPDESDKSRPLQLRGVE